MSLTNNFNEKALEITVKIIARMQAAIDNGTPLKWQKNWESSGDFITTPKRWNGEAYRGINFVSLWCKKDDKGYDSDYWFSFKQAEKLGGMVQKGEKGTLTVFWDRMTKTVEKDGEEMEKKFGFLKHYFVFNANQIKGLDEKYYAKPEPLDPVETIKHADDFFKNTGADIRHRGGMAFYNPTLDYVQVPPPAAFHDLEGFYSTLAHEMGHWAGPKVGADYGGKKFGDEGYAREELSAELTAPLVCSNLGIISEPREENAAYLQSWINRLKAKPMELFNHAADAQRRCDYLYSFQPAPLVRVTDELTHDV